MQLSLLPSSGLYTAGYQGRTPEAFVRLLERHDIRQVIDVREHPVSRRPGFGKTALSKALAAAGIDYVHIREAGNPFRHDPGAEGWEPKYAEYLDTHPQVIDAVCTAASRASSVLLCFERVPADCHRTILATRVAAHLGVSFTAI